MQYLQNESDELKIASNKVLTRQFEPDEEILLSANIFKFNERCKKKEKVFLLTNKYIYNISRTTIKRKIPTAKVKAITISNIGNEFVVHIADEYDERYLHSEKRDKIVDLLSKLHKNYHGSPMDLQFKDEISLAKYAHKKGDERDLATYDTIYTRDKGRNVTIDDFRLIKSASRFGKVLIVKLKDTGEIFALKSLKKGEVDQLESARTEIMIFQKIDHPFLVNLEYCFQNKEKIFIVMPFLKGGELFQYLRREKRFSESRAKFYGAQVALALGYLHSNHIIYRDLKPEHILMDEDGYLVITDFGMAKVLDDNTLADSNCGTPEYLAPEVIAAEGPAPEADWWGLGILMYELMVGIPPFYNQNHNTMFQLIQTSDLKFHPKIKMSDEAKDFISQCLKKNPKERLGHKEDIAEIKAHPWFRDLDWDALVRKQIPPPFKPKLNSDLSMDFSDEDIGAEEPINPYTSIVDPEVLKKFDEQFLSPSNH